MSSISFTRSLDAFFDGEDKVLVIKGNWGVGKTFSWNAYIEARIAAKDLHQIAYSYVSLFGKTSLADIRASIFQNGKPIATPERIEDEFEKQISLSSGLLKSLPWFREATKKAQEKVPLLGRFTKAARLTPFTDKFSGLIASLEYSLVKNYVICFDDLERKGAALSVREMMGLADELAQRKDCKIILIFNDNSFTGDQDKFEFEAYREKVVDTEITYAPTHTENLSHAILETHPLFSRFEKVVIALDLKNIRVSKKIYRLVDAFWPLLKDCDESILTEFANHASVLSWSYFMREAALPFDFLKERLSKNPWDSYFQSKDKETPPDEKRYRALSSVIDLSPSAFDNHILHFLEHGYVNENALKSEILELAKKMEARRAHNELNAAWKLYTDSFRDNQNEIVMAFRKVLLDDYDKLSISDFAGAIDMLADFGEDVTKILELYVKTHTNELAAMNQHDSFLARRVSYKPLLDRINTIQASRINLDIDEVTTKIAVNKGWNPEDIDFLTSLSIDDYYQWIMKSPPDLTTKIRSGLLFFKNLQSRNSEDSKKYLQIYECTKAALIKLGAESSLNMKRIQKIYDIGDDDDVAAIIESNSATKSH